MSSRPRPDNRKVGDDIFINNEYVASLTPNDLIWDDIYPEDFFDRVEWIG